MSPSDEHKVVGRKGLIRMNDLDVSVIIQGVRLKSHAVDYLIEPMAGHWKTWIDGHQAKIVGWFE